MRFFQFDKMFSLLLILMGLIFLNHCGTQTGSGVVTVGFKSYNSSLLSLSQLRAVTNVKLCFKRVRFKTEGEGTSSNHDEDPDNIEFAIGEVTLSSSGTSLGNIDLGLGNYRRVEFDLHNDCGFGSIQVTNSSGTFSTNDGITIKFEGTFNLANANQTLSLGLQAIINALNGVTQSNAIKDTIEAATGDF